MQGDTNNALLHRAMQGSRKLREGCLLDVWFQAASSHLFQHPQLHGNVFPCSRESQEHFPDIAVLHTAVPGAQQGYEIHSPSSTPDFENPA